MSTNADNNASSRRRVYVLLIALAAAMAAGRILSAELVYEPSLSRNWPDDPGHYRRPWPATPPRAMPTFSSNDRSRWAAVRALVDRGTWIVGRRDKQIVIASVPAALAARDAVQLAVLLEVGYERRVKNDSGIIFEDGYQSVDKMLNPTTLEFYSTKPPLLTFLIAGEYWLLKHTLGWSLIDESGGQRDRRFAIVRVCLLTFNVVPFAFALWLLARLVDRFGATDWGRVFVVAAACFGTMATPFLLTLNNHTPALCGVIVTVYATVRILSKRCQEPFSETVPDTFLTGWTWFIVAGFAAGFTAVNELPAAAFAAGLGLLLLPRFPKQTLRAYVPAALAPVAALLALNYAQLGEFDLGYSKFGTEWYEYEGSHWRNLPDKSKRGIDWAKNKEGKATYALNLLLGHHGWFSLTPIYVLALGGMGLGIRRLIRKPPPHPQPLSPEAGERGEGQLPHPQPLSPEGGNEQRFFSPLPRSGGEGLGVRGRNLPAPRLWAELAVSTLLLSLLVIGYYIFKSNNYGGWTNGPRWLMWLSPLWLLTLLPIVDRLERRRWGRVLCIVLLALSVLSAHYWDWNPWRHPWIYNVMDERGYIPY